MCAHKRTKLPSPRQEDLTIPFPLMATPPVIKYWKSKKSNPMTRISEALSLREGGPVIYVERLIWADNKPIGLDTIYVSETTFPDFIQKAASEKPLYHILREDYGLEVAEATLEINGILADSSKASLLKCLVGDPLFHVRKNCL